MSELKDSLKHAINHCDDKELPGKLCEILNRYCESDSVWYYDENKLSIDIGLDEQDNVIKFIEDLVDCSYINKSSKASALLTLSFTVSTLINKIK